MTETSIITEHPGAVLAVGTVVTGVMSWGATKIWKLLRENQRLRSEQQQQRTDALAQAIEDLKEAMHDAIDRLTETIERIDSRHNTMVSDVYQRITQTETKIDRLMGEHEARIHSCPGEKALHEMLRRRKDD